MPVSVGPPHALPIREFLPFPDLDLFLDLLQGFLPGPPRGLPVRRAHGDEYALHADGHVPELVDDTDALQAVLLLDALRYLHHGAQREGRVGRVVEVGDGLAVEGVAGGAGEEDRGPRGGGAHVG